MTKTQPFNPERPLDNTDIPNIVAPAQRALFNVGVRCLNHVTKFSKKELLTLHGFGPKAIQILQETFKQKGLSFA